MFNMEADIIARIESLELEVRAIRRRLEHTTSMEDKRVLDRQIGELTVEIQLLRDRILPRPPRLVPVARI